MIDDSNNFTRIIWDYHHLNHTLVKSDLLLVLGSHATRIAERAVSLLLLS